LEELVEKIKYRELLPNESAILMHIPDFSKLSAKAVEAIFYEVPVEYHFSREEKLPI